MAEELAKKPAELSDTVEMMLSTDYKERFVAEYVQTGIGLPGAFIMLSMA